MNSRLEKLTTTYFKDVARLIEELDLESIAGLAMLIYGAFEGDKTTYFIGNGGSASIASHMGGDIGKNTTFDYRDPTEKRIKSVALTDNQPFITAVANDIGYEWVFVEQLKNVAQPGDVLVVVSSSGNSANVVKAAEWAKENGLKVGGLVGFKGGRIKELADACVWVPVEHYGYVEGIHGEVQHYLIDALKELKRNGR